MIRKQWTDDLLKQELINVCKLLGKFPSVSELKSLNRNDLQAAITKRGGILLWAKNLGFDRETSCSDIGWEGEKKVTEILSSRNFIVDTRTTVKSPYDLIIDKVARVDVKTTSYTEYGYSKGWFYRIGKYVQSDFVLLYQSDTNDLFVIPWIKVNASNITITKTGDTYTLYKNNFELLTNYIKKYKEFLNFE